MWDPTIREYPYDLATARRLLAEAGYPNGFRLPVGIDFTPQTGNPQVMLALQSALKEIGIEANLNSTELAVFLDKYYGRAGQTKGDLFVVTTSDTNGFAPTIRGLINCSVTLVWWCNQEYDKLLSDAAAEPDLAKRSVLMKRANNLLQVEVSHANMLLIPTFIVHSPKIKGFNWGSQHRQYYHFDDAFRVD
jgi:ABC-type transport system substrate-binding protein